MGFRPLALSLVVLLNLPCAAVAQPSSRETPIRIVTAVGVSGPLAEALEQALERHTLPPEADEADEELELRRAERNAREVLATEGYFEPQLKFEPNPAGTPRYRLVVTTGPRTHVASVALVFDGVISEPAHAERVEALRKSWPLKVGTPFQSAAWETAKARLLAALQDHDFAAAVITDSSAQIDVDASSANLRVQLNSGPVYRLGPLTIEGLKRYEPSLVQRYNPFKPGDPYDRTRLAEFQQSLQDTPFFSSVVVTVDLDPATADNAPLKIELKEAASKRLATGIGYGTNTGAHLEVAYRQAMIFGEPYPLQSGFRIDQKGGFAYADVLFPPKRGGGPRDSVGVLYEDSDIEDLHTRRYGIGAARSTLRGPRDGRNIETQLSVNFEHELQETPLGAPLDLNTLSTTYNWIRRDINDITNPRSGNQIQLQATLGTSGLEASDIFGRGFARIVHFIPVGLRDVLILRGEVGSVAAKSSNNVSNTFLFRTGGSTTVRGYDYESLGVEQNGAIVGGRALAVASVEYVHWLTRWDGNLGLATFIDAGDAAQTWGDLDPAVGAGVGVRWKTPAGPLAFDVAYGERFNQVRVHFSVAIAF